MKKLMQFSVGVALGSWGLNSMVPLSCSLGVRHLLAARRVLNKSKQGLEWEAMAYKRMNGLSNVAG